MFKDLEIIIGYRQTMIVMGFSPHTISYILTNSSV
jgi:hypothetical protein